MGPLFSLLLIVVLALCATLVCFVAAVFFLPARRAALASITAVLGGGVGVVLAAVATIPFVGTGQTLSSGAAVMAYLGAPACGGVFGGIAAVVFYLRRTPKRGEHAL